MQYTDFVTLFNLYCFNYFIKTLIIIGCINFVLNLLLVRSVCLLVDFFATTCSKVLFVVKKVNFQQVEIFLFEYSIRVIYFVGILHQADIFVGILNQVEIFLLEYSIRVIYFVGILHQSDIFCWNTPLGRDFVGILLQVEIFCQHTQ